MFRRTLFVISALVLAACGGGDNVTGNEAEDLDLDNDGILNAVDACPNQAETVNNVFDSDGCPDTPEEFYEAVRADAETFWVGALAGSLFPYRALTAFVAYTIPVNTPCGIVSLNNAFYCPASEGVYYDSNFLQLFLDAIGDMAPAFIITHEIGHHVSNILGWVAPTVISTKEAELQADCFAGAWTFDAGFRGQLEPGDLEEAVVAVIAAGDPADTWFDPTLHGTAVQRTVAFGVGFDFGGGECTTAGFFDLFLTPAK